MDTPALPLADLPPRPIDAWREHTAKNWKSSDPESYAVCIEMITQHGITSISDLQRELKTLVREALAASAVKQPEKKLSVNADDYYIHLFNIGWEGIGHWEAEAKLSGLSLKGLRKR